MVCDIVTHFEPKCPPLTPKLTTADTGNRIEFGDFSWDVRSLYHWQDAHRQHTRTYRGGVQLKRWSTAARPRATLLVVRSSNFQRPRNVEAV